MEKGLIYRIGLVLGIMLVATLALVPSIEYDYRANKTLLPTWWPTSFSNNLVLGLDLQGGMDLVVSVSAEEAVVNELRHFSDLIQNNMRSDRIAFTKVDVDAHDRLLSVEYPDSASMLKGSEYIRKSFLELFVTSGEGSLKQVYALRDAAADQILRRSVDQVKQILGRRMDAFGLREPEIVVQGRNRVRLQLPGVTDPTRIKENITRTAKLEFMLVTELGKLKDAAEKESGGPPAGMVLASWTDPNKPESKIECYFSSGGKIGEGPVGKDIKLLPGVAKTGEAENSTCYALREDVTVSGADLKDSRPGYDPEQLSGSVVNFQFNMKGAQRFGKITGEHINEQLAVVLEDRVMSAPVIRSRIFDRGQIEGGFTNAEATDLANVLRSGALDVNIKIEEERTVGASLGADSIRKGTGAALWGSVAVIVFMIIYYSVGGVIADLALLLNIMLIMAALSLFGATLTLPGLAGIVLTVGMSVDANVLIFERAREELRVGKTPRSAMEAGYSKALWTILDSNITTLIGALVLLQWGTGPIKGFAVTLSLGIIFSVFTSVVVTRIIYEVMFYYRKGAKLHLGIKVEPVAGAR